MNTGYIYNTGGHINAESENKRKQTVLNRPVPNSETDCTKFVLIWVTAHFGHDPFRPKAWTIRPNNIDVSAIYIYIFNSFTESDIIISRGNHRLNCVRSVDKLMYN